MTDPIADMLNRIKNAQAVGHESASFGFSNMKYEIAGILQRKGVIRGAEKKGRKEKKIIKVILKSPQESFQVKRVSKPGQRIYVSANNIKPVRAGYGFLIISTPKGLMDGKEAKKNKVGGEILCEICPE